MAERSAPDTGACIIGVDGCRAGWVVATGTAAPTPQLESLEVVPQIGPVIDRIRTGTVAVVGIDMPMGLPDAGQRACDVEARRRLGPRRSSVFPTPVRAALGSADHREALRRSRAVDGRGLSIQAFNLLAKIAELDAVVDPTVAETVLEVHPESSFATMAGAPLTSTKRSPAGRAERLDLLARHVGGSSALLSGRRAGAAPDDLADAVAVLWSVARWATGTAIVLGDGAVDRRGLPMRITI